MRGIFISYRREDTEGQAGRLFDDLSARFGRDAVFMDVAGIKKGLDFRRIIHEHVTSCGVLLVLIGKGWLSASDPQGKRRLDDPNDFVRLETAAALSRDIPVVPVLVQGASMPTEKELPGALRELAFRNGAELTHARWDSDVEALIGDLKPYLETTASTEATQSRPAPPAGSNESPPRKSGIGRSLWAAGAAAVIIGGVAGYLLLPNGARSDARAKVVVVPQVVPPVAPPVAPAIEPRSVDPTPPSKGDPRTSPKPPNEPVKPDTPPADPDAAKAAAAKAAADAAAKAAAAKAAAAARKEAEDRRRRDEAQRATQLAEEQRRRDDEQQRIRDEEQRKRDEQARQLALERAEKERAAAEQAAAARFFTEFATAVIGGRQGNRR